MQPRCEGKAERAYTNSRGLQCRLGGQHAQLSGEQRCAGPTSVSSKVICTALPPTASKECLRKAVKTARLDSGKPAMQRSKTCLAAAPSFHNITKRASGVNQVGAQPAGEGSTGKTTGQVLQAAL